MCRHGSCLMCSHGMVQGWEQGRARRNYSGALDTTLENNMSLRSTDQYLIHSKEDKIREVIKKQALSAVGFVSRLQSPLSFLGLLLVLRHGQRPWRSLSCTQAEREGEQSSPGSSGSSADSRAEFARREAACNLGACTAALHSKFGFSLQIQRLSLRGPFLSVLKQFTQVSHQKDSSQRNI